MEVASKNLHKHGPTWCANLFTGVLGKQDGLVWLLQAGSNQIS